MSVRSTSGIDSQTVHSLAPSANTSAASSSSMAASDYAFDPQNGFQETALYIFQEVEKFYRTRWLPMKASGMQLETSMDFYRFKVSHGMIDDTANSNVRKIFESCSREIVTKVCAVHMNPDDSILEVGAGVIDSATKTSYLTALFPAELRKKVVYADANPRFSQLKIDGVDYRYAQLSELDKSIGAQAVDHVASMCVFDTISPTALPKIFSAVQKVLRPDGKFTIFSNLQPFMNTLLSKYACDPENIVFPLVDTDGFWAGIQYVKRDRFEKWIQDASNQQKYPDEAGLFAMFLSIEPVQREFFVIDLNPSKMKFILSELFKQHFGNARTEVYNEEFYTNNMREGLLKAGFEIESFGLQHSRDVVDSAQLPEVCGTHNFFQEQHGRVNSRPCYVIAPGKSLLEFNMHVIVAKKVHAASAAAVPEFD